MEVKSKVLLIRLILLSFALFCFILKVDAQNSLTESPKELLYKIQKSKPDTNRIRLQLKLGEYYLYKPDKLKKNFDSAIFLLNQAAQLSYKLHDTAVEFRTMELIGDYYAKAGNLERCKAYFMRVIDHYRQTGDSAHEALAWEWLGLMYNNNGNNDYRDEKINCFQHARALYFKSNKPLKAADMLENIADAQVGNKQFELAEHQLQQVLIEYKALGYKYLQETYSSLYTLEYTRGNYYRAMAYCLEAITVMKANRDTAQIASFYYYMARCNYSVKKNTEALDWIKKALTSGKRDVYKYNYRLVEILLALNRTGEAGKILNHLSQIKSSAVYREDTVYVRRMFARYYTKINKNNLAIDYYLAILKLDFRKYLTEENSNNLNIICNNELSGIYLKTNQLSKAGKYLSDASLKVKNASTTIQPDILVDLYYNLYKYDVATGSYRAAVKHLEQHNRIKDSLFTTDKDKQVSELNIQYQTAQKEKAIQNLHNQSIVQQTKLDNVNLQRNITILGVAVFIIIAGIAYNGYRHKQHTNLQLQHKQLEINQQNYLLQQLLKDKDELLSEKDWLLKEVHHRVKNNLQITISLLSVQARSTTNQVAREVLLNGQRRLHSMSLIHQKLYQSEKLAFVEMSGYIRDMVAFLKRSFDNTNHITFKTETDELELDVAQAVPLGLILNEAITNAIKYAFPDRRKGEVIVTLSSDNDGLNHLIVSDNGIGIAEQVAAEEKKTFGMELLKILTKQIDGEISIDGKNGTTVSVKFKVINLIAHNIST